MAKKKNAAKAAPVNTVVKAAPAAEEKKAAEATAAPVAEEKAAPKAEEKKAAPAPKAEKAPKAAKAPKAEKAPAKTEEKAPKAEKKAAKAETVVVEMAGKQIDPAQVIEDCKAAYKNGKRKVIKTINVYINADQKKAYYVVNGVSTDENGNPLCIDL